MVPHWLMHFYEPFPKKKVSFVFKKQTSKLILKINNYLINLKLFLN